MKNKAALRDWFAVLQGGLFLPADEGVLLLSVPDGYCLVYCFRRPKQKESHSSAG